MYVYDYFEIIVIINIHNTLALKLANARELAYGFNALKSQASET